MSNKRFPKNGDNVRFVNENQVEKHKDRIFTVKSRSIVNKKIVITLNEIKGSYEVKNLEIVT